MDRYWFDIYLDGNAWCVLMGENIQEGICGFGATKHEALREFVDALADDWGETFISYTTLRTLARELCDAVVRHTQNCLEGKDDQLVDALAALKCEIREG